MPRNKLIQVRRGTAAQWADADTASATDPARLLAAGEPGYDTTNDVYKIGDGASKWSDLPGFVNDATIANRYQAQNTRRGLASSGAGTNVVTAGASKALFRFVYRVPRTATRVRFRYHNYNSISDTIGAQDVTLNVGVGLPAFDAASGLATGNYDTTTVTPTMVVSNQALAGGAAPFHSAWIDVASLPAKPGDLILVSMHVSTATASGSRSWMRSNVFTYWKNECTLANYLTDAVTVGSNAPAYGDFSVEADCTSDEGILVVGDSYADGFGDTLSGTIGGFHLSIPACLAELTGLPVASTAVSGGTLNDFAVRDDTSSIWEKVDFAGSSYTTAVLMSLPNNDTGSNYTPAQIQANYATLVARLRAKGIGRIIGVTVPPRGNTAGILAAPVAVGASSFTGNYGVPIGLTQVGIDGSIETVNVTSVTGSSAPYTITISGTFAKAHAAAEPYDKSVNSEATRQTINYWLRGRPLGLLDVLDLDAMYRDPANPIQLLAGKNFDSVHLSGAEQRNVAKALVPFVTT